MKSIRFFLSSRAAFLACVCVLACASVSSAEDAPAAPSFTPSPAWREDSSPVRYVFGKPEGAQISLLSFPGSLNDGGAVQEFAARSGDVELATRIISNDGTNAHVFVHSGPVSDGGLIEVYPLAVKVRPDTNLTDGLPIDCAIRGVDIQDVPAGWKEYQFLRNKLPGPYARYKARTFEECVSNEVFNNNDIRRAMFRHVNSFEFTTTLNIPEAGDYRFDLAGRNTCILVIDPEERVIAESSVPLPFGGRRHDNSEALPENWIPGETVHLEPGPVQLRCIQLTRRHPNVRVRWLRPGNTDTTPVPADVFLTGSRVEPVVREERRDRPVHVGIKATASAPFQFHRTEGLFVLLDLEAHPAVWNGGSPDDLSFEWSVDGEPVGKGKTLRTVISSGRRVIRVTAVSPDGLSVSAEKILENPPIARTEYRIDAAIRGVPGLLRETDLVWPDLWVRGTLPRQIPVSAELRVFGKDGSTLFEKTDSVRLVKSWGRLLGDPVRVSDALEISWKLFIGPCLLASNTVTLVRDPADAVPTGAFGDQLMAGDRPVSLVLRHERTEDDGRAVERLRAAERVVWLDDTFTPLTAVAADTKPPLTSELEKSLGKPVEFLAPEALSDSTAPEALLPLSPLGGLRTIPDKTAVVLSLGRDTYLNRVPAEEFELRLSAYCAILSRGLGHSVLLVTPPPFSEDPAAFRPYAEAVLRVADAYAIPVADAYSAFAAASGKKALTDGLDVGPDGGSLAVRLLLRFLGK